MKDIQPTARELEILGQLPKEKKKKELKAQDSLTDHTEVRLTPTGSEYEHFFKNNVV